ncbi:hypothetical protein F4810DRAFT_708742 [Camillea tinctor]|nr:hypothetical protein F4810DRAFT_708742 [Camillea tinctor]
MTSSVPTTTARGEVTYPAPGAFPTDDLTPRDTPNNTPILGGPSQDSPKHREPNKLHKRDDPRGRESSEAQRLAQAPTRGHKHVDSGVYIPEMDTSETAAPGFNASTTKDTHHGNVGNHTKPGVMTGAYSRLPTHEQKSGTTDGVPIFANSPISNAPATTTGTYNHAHPVSEQPHNTRSHDHASIAGLTGASVLAGGTAAASHKNTSHPTATTTNTNTGTSYGAPALSPPQENKILETQSEEQERNVVRNGRDHSSLARKDPYWGDVPFGTGVYNGVAGHGSAEAPHAGSVGTGKHEGQGGETENPRHVLIAGSQQQQRAFPLAGGASNTSTDKEQTQQSRDSRFTEGLVAAGVASGAGYVASQHGDKKQSQREGSGRKGSVPEDKKEKDASGHGLVGGLFHRDNNDKEVKDKTHVSADHEAKKAKAAEEKEKEKALKKERDHSKEAAAAAAAAAAAGTAYAARDRKSSRDAADSDEGSEKRESKLHGLFHRSHKDKQNDEQNAPEAGVVSNSRSPTTTTTPSPSSTTKAQDHAYGSNNNKDQTIKAGKLDPFVAAGYPDQQQHSSTSPTTTSPTSIYPTSQKHAGKDSNATLGLGLGTAGVAAGAGAGYLAHQHHTKGEPKSADVSPKTTTTHIPGTATTAPTTGIGNTISSPTISHPSQKQTTAATTLPTSTSPSSTKSPRTATDLTQHANDSDAAAPHYKVLASGTPSGIAVDTGDKTSHHSASPPTRSAAGLGETPTRSAAGESAPTSGKGYKYAAAGAGALGAGAAGYYAGQERGPEQEQIGGGGDNLGLAARQKTVMHKCRRCGEEEDISGYFRG